MLQSKQNSHRSRKCRPEQRRGNKPANVVLVRTVHRRVCAGPHVCLFVRRVDGERVYMWLRVNAPSSGSVRKYAKVNIEFLDIFISW